MVVQLILLLLLLQYCTTADCTTNTVALSSTTDGLLVLVSFFLVFVAVFGFVRFLMSPLSVLLCDWLLLPDRSLLLAELEKEEKEKDWYYAQLQNLTKRIDSLPLTENVNKLTVTQDVL